MSTPKPVTWLNYPGDVTSSVEVGQPMGPTLFEEVIYVVEAVYDPDQDSTRVGFTYLHPNRWV